MILIATARSWFNIVVNRPPVSAGVPHVGTHGIRHRSATDIANSGVPIKVGMELTQHKTVAQFMHYVHVEPHRVSRRPVGLSQTGLV